MELSSHQEGEIPIPINSAYVGGGGGGGGHGLMIHHHHHHDRAPHNNIISVAAAAAGAASPPINNGPPNISISTNLEEEQEEEEQEEEGHHQQQQQQQQQNGSSAAAIINKKITAAAAAAHDHHDHHVTIKYKECLKNHAAAMGGNATDGCGEFMPSGEEGTIEALTCSACNCHRNFHRKEFEGGSSSQQMIANPFDHFFHPHPHHNFSSSRVGRKVILGHHHHHKNILAATPEALGYPTPAGTIISSRAGGAIMSYNLPGGGSESDEHEMGAIMRPATAAQQLVMSNNKKRFRTKFTPEQKEKMLNFAEKAGWKIQKQEESVVQQLCQEIGVKRRVLKVWMHNNKHNLAKRQQQHNHHLPSSTTA